MISGLEWDNNGGRKSLPLPIARIDIKWPYIGVQQTRMSGLMLAAILKD
jgi:hypothetical protein